MFPTLNPKSPYMCVFPPYHISPLQTSPPRGFKAMEEDPTLRECPECQELVKPAMLPCEARFRNLDKLQVKEVRMDQW